MTSCGQDNDDIADHSQGLTKLQTRPANPVLGLKSDPNELDTLGGDSGSSQLLPVNDTAAAQLATTTGGLGQEAKFSEWGATACSLGGGGGGGGGGGWGPLQPVGVLLGVEAQVLGHPPQQGHGAPMQGRMHGVQEAVVQEAADEAQAVQHKTPAGVVPIRKHMAAGMCDAYCERGCDLILFSMIDVSIT